MDEDQGKNVLERLLGIFTEVRGGEGTKVLLLTLNVFLILTAYYIIKPVREALILAGEGAEVKAYAAAGQALLLLLAVPLYTFLASRLPRRHLINVVTIFFIVCLFVFYILAQFQVPLGVIFYLWVGIFNLMVVAQFWSFANDVYSPEEGKRLFVLVAFGASSGAVFGSFITGRLIEPMGVYQLLLVGAGILASSLIISNWIDSREKERALSRESDDLTEPEEAMGKEGAFKLVWQNKYLLSIAFLMLLLNWVNTTGEYILSRMVTESAEAAVAAGTAGGLTVGDYIGKFYSNFFAIVNLFGMLAQLFLVSRILKHLGVSIAILILPAISLTGYASIAIFPILAMVRWVKTAENSTDYSLQNTVRNVLFLPTTREEKYKAKQAIDTFFHRAGDVLQAVVVFVGTTFLAWNVSNFAWLNVGLAAVWFVLALRIGRRHRALLAERAQRGNAG